MALFPYFLLFSFFLKVYTYLVKVIAGGLSCKNIKNKARHSMNAFCDKEIVSASKTQAFHNQASINT